ncbi:MAG: phosphate transport system regulatory protein PhoU [Spirochaetes bacterium RBG_16_49_21]|nr:MAG: phosphate transport system regulatory protein PhoU [Spirochaetes bacterium RBG_16_49_21]
MAYQHTDREYQAQLNMIRDRMITMTEKAAAMVSDGIRAFINNDIPLAKKTMRLEEEVNELELEIDDLCVSVLAKQQPVASDLRFLVAVLKLVPNIERIGDHAVTICKRAGECASHGGRRLPDDLLAMGDILRSMLDDARTAFVGGDAVLAEKIIERDALLDAHYAEIFRASLKIIENDPADTFEAMNIQAVIKNIERMGDHVKNLAELVIYMTRGRDVRHRESLESAKKNIRGVLFLCVHNSARSQMAEGLARRIFPPGTAVYSAGSDPGPGINPRAIRAMAEIGIDISSQKPKKISSVPVDEIDVIITLCGEELCVELPARRSETWNLSDPARFTGDEEDIQAKMNALRDELRSRIEAANRELFQ